MDVAAVRGCVGAARRRSAVCGLRCVNVNKAVFVGIHVNTIVFTFGRVFGPNTRIQISRAGIQQVGLRDDQTKGGHR